MRHTFGRRRAAGAVLAAGLGVGVLAGCGNDTAGPEAGASVQDVQQEQEPAQAAESDVMSFVGMTVTVSADVNEIINERAFTIAGTENTGVESLLVIAAQPGVTVNEDSAVAVTGEVRKAFDIAAVESEFGFDYDDALFDAYDGEPYIVAEKIDPTVAEPAEATEPEETPAPAN